jgi:peptidylprolyl isomerase
MTDAKTGDTVRIHYTGTLSDGTTFDSSAGRDPLQFEVGSGQIIPGLDSAIPGMSVGDKKTVEVPSEAAYGPHHPEGVQTVPRDQFPPDLPTDPGTRLEMRGPDGRGIPVVIVETTDETVKLDANHPLAGKDLTFDIELMEIV